MPVTEADTSPTHPRNGPAPRNPGRPDAARDLPAEEPIDVRTIRATTARALAEGPPPRYDVLVELEGLLRGHIQLLLPGAEVAVAGMWRGSVDWYDRRTWLDDVRHHLASGLGDGLMSALSHARQLARDCTVLLRYVEAER